MAAREELDGDGPESFTWHGMGSEKTGGGVTVVVGVRGPRLNPSLDFLGKSKSSGGLLLKNEP